MWVAYRMLCVLAVFLAFAFAAQSRGPDGRLDIILTPNNGIPALTRPGGFFSAMLRQEPQHIELRGSAGTFPLSAEWKPLPGGRKEGKMTIDATTPPGTYALHVSAAGREDENLRAVYVYDAFPEAYRIAHVTDLHVGSGRHPRPSEAILLDLIDAVNESEAAFALITGDVTENGEEDQFRSLLKILDACRMPTFVVPGNHDRQAGNFEAFFGLLTYAFTFGQDGYLAFDTKDFMVADDMGAQNGQLHRFRRELMPKRWSIGFTHRYEPMMGMRAQLTLFVDDPLDYLLYGHYHREPKEGDGIPWGRTAFIMTPAAIDGTWRMVEINDQGVHQQQIVQSAEIR